MFVLFLRYCLDSPRIRIHDYRICKKMMVGSGTYIVLVSYGQAQRFIAERGARELLAGVGPVVHRRTALQEKLYQLCIPEIWKCFIRLQSLDPYGNWAGITFTLLDNFFIMFSIEPGFELEVYQSECTEDYWTVGRGHLYMIRINRCSEVSEQGTAQVSYTALLRYIFSNLSSLLKLI